ncbi:MAG TPA: hypothetical protein ENJ60_07815 [Aeromonadales bacterium]|nr:hypothetical protein [Aeromonadales bacterium]
MKFKIIVLVFLMATIPSTLSATNKYDKKHMFNAYQGSYAAKYIQVEKANRINLMIDVWSGFPKNMWITLSGISVPVVDKKSSTCKMKLAQEGIKFSKEYFEKSKWIKVKNIFMERTDMIDGVASIYTDKGMLSDLLKKSGFARSSSIDAKIPWC